MARLAVLVMLAAVSAEGAAAQGARPRPQRVDPLTASIRGAITTADTGAPIRGAEVRLSNDGRYSRLVTSNGDGRFELRDLPAGEYKLMVSRAGFISLQYGQRRPFEASKTITLAEGQNVTANVGLIRGGAIYGRLHDQFGDPLAGTRVQVLRSRMVQGQRRLQSVGAGDQTDDTGAFRVYGLAPGDYYVAASTGVVDAVKRDPPIYYPGTPSIAEAQPITLGAGAEATADFQLAAVRNVRVSGVVLNSRGSPVPAMVNLNSEAVGMGPTMEGTGVPPLQLHADAAPDGTFTIENVPPGPYNLTAMVMFPPDPFEAFTARPKSDPTDRIPETAAMPIVITGDDLSGVTLVTRAGGRLSVRFVADAGVVRSLPTGIRVSMRGLQTGGMQMTMGGRGTADELSLRGMSGPFQLDVQGVPEGWVVSAIMMDGANVIDEAIDLNGESASVRIVLTDRVTSLNGTVQSRGDVGEQSVVVFSDDAAKWKYPSRYVRTTRADREGGFQIRGLPPDERYLAVAVDYIDDGEEEDSQFLERLRNRASSFSLQEGEQRSIQLDAIAR